MKLSGEKISYAYAEKKIFDDVSFEIKSGQVSCIVGPNGAGKSTLVKCIGNLYSPQTGAIYLDGEKITSIKPTELAKLLGYVPQSEKASFSLNVFEAVLLGRRPYVKWRVSEEDIQIVTEILHRLKLSELAEREISMLSGGERQKVAIARALAQEPSILLLDEPTSSLDMNHQIEIMELIKDLAINHQVTVVMIIHDLNLAARYADWVYLLRKNGIYASGTPKEVFTQDKIRAVYGVEVEIFTTSQGQFIIPIKSNAVSTVVNI